jgi:hypothetical protein
VPLLVRGSYNVLSYTHKGFRFTPVGLTVGEPIEPPRKPRYRGEDYAALMEAWRRAIVRLRREDDARGGPTAGRSPRIHEETAADV